MKVMTIVGTRPEIIRLSSVIRRLDSTPGIEHVLVHTGQNYDYELNQVFFDDFGLRPPNHLLGVDTTTLGSVLGGILIAAERVLLEESPDAVLILGDTNSSISALMARRMKIPVYHMEAGNRCFDLNVPEETNRRLVDHISDFNLVYTEHARRNLLAEGIHPRRIMKTGSPMREVLTDNLEHIRSSTALSDNGLTSNEYFLVSAHREENVDNPLRLQQLLQSLELISVEYALPVIMSTHPRTLARIRHLGKTLPASLHLLKPFGFHDYNALQLAAKCVLSDSGTISEEAAILGFPAVTLRDSIERPEALDSGTVIMTGVTPAEVLPAVAAVSKTHKSSEPPEDYNIEDTSARVVNFILSTAHRHHAWAGIRKVTQ